MARERFMMPEGVEDVRHFRADWQQLRQSKVIHQHVLQNLRNFEVATHLSHELEGLVMEVSAFVAEYPVEKRDFRVEVEVPASWWQHFKKEVFPRWYLRRWPYRTVTVEDSTTIAVTRRVCPHVLRENGQEEHLDWLVDEHTLVTP